MTETTHVVGYGYHGIGPVAPACGKDNDTNRGGATIWAMVRRKDMIEKARNDRKLRGQLQGSSIP